MGYEHICQTIISFRTLPLVHSCVRLVGTLLLVDPVQRRVAVSCGEEAQWATQSIRIHPTECCQSYLTKQRQRHNENAIMIMLVVEGAACLTERAALSFCVSTPTKDSLKLCVCAEMLIRRFESGSLTYLLPGRCWKPMFRKCMSDSNPQVQQSGITRYLQESWSSLL